MAMPQTLVSTTKMTGLLGQNHGYGATGTSRTEVAQGQHGVQMILGPLDQLEDDQDDASDTEDTPLIRTTYARLRRTYALVPITCGLAIFALMSLQLVVWPSSGSRHNHLPVWEFIVSAGAWCVAHHVRHPLYLVATACGLYPNYATLAIALVFQVLSQLAVRLAAIVLLRVRLHEPVLGTEEYAFAQVWWLGLGWAAAEVSLGIAQHYEHLTHYQPILPERELSLDDDEEMYWQDNLNQRRGSPPASLPQQLLYPDPEPISPVATPLYQHEPRRVIDPVTHLEEEMANLLSIRARTELEDVYGLPLPNIPVFVSILQRLDSIILSLAWSLLLSSTYLTALSQHPLPPLPEYPHTPRYDTHKAILETLPTFAGLALIQTLLVSLWTHWLPAVGVHSAGYIALLVGLGMLFTGLAAWGGLS